MRKYTPEQLMIELDRRMIDSERTRKQEEIREFAWYDNGCQTIYKSLIDCAGGMKSVRPGMRGQAKQIAISCFLKNKTPDYKEFKLRVKNANKKIKHWKKHVNLYQEDAQ